MHSVFKMYFLLLITAIVAVIATGTSQEVTNQNVTIVVAGLAGVGKSATVSTLLHHKFVVEENDSEPMLQVYTRQFNETNSNLNIVDSTGLVVDTGHTNDGRTLALLSNYIKTMKENHQSVSTFLIVGSFNDARAAGESSNFVQMLKRVQLLLQRLTSQNIVDNDVKCIFLFTQVGGVPKSLSRRPQERLSQFKQIIRNYTTEFNYTTIHAVIGENDAEGYGFDVTPEGFTKLPNNELYPKNLIDVLIQEESTTGNTGTQSVLTELLQNYNKDSATSSRSIQYDTAIMQVQGDMFSQQIIGLTFGQQSTTTASGDEIAEKIKEVWSNDISMALKQGNPGADQILLRMFQIRNITKISHLPKTIPEIATLFTCLPKQAEIYNQILYKAFNIQQPQLTEHLVAGYGYDLVTDSVLYTSPWNLDMNRQIPSEIGYKIPAAYILTLVDQEEDVYHYLDKIEDYVPSRLKYLRNAPPASEFTNFGGEIRLGFNVLPEESSDQFTLTALKEFHKFQLQVDQTKLSLGPDFVASIQALERFNQSNRESEKEWKSFFSEFGTHVIISCNGGGYMQASMQVSAASLNRNIVEILKDTLVKFEPRPLNYEGKMSHLFFGGSPVPEMEDIFGLTNKTKQQQLIQTWKDSIKVRPKMMENRLDLKPISEVAVLVDPIKGGHVGEAVELLLKGQLKYVRPVRVKQPSGTRRTTTTVATTTTTTTVRSTPQPKVPSTTSKVRAYSDNGRPPAPATVKTTPRPSREPRDPAAAPTQSCTPPRPQKPKLMSDLDLPVGNGYHMFHDAGVPKSPFVLGSTTSKHGIQYKANLHFSDAGTIHTFCSILPKYTDYIKARIEFIELKSESGKLWSLYGTPGQDKYAKQFHYTTKPGYSLISDWTKTNKISNLYEQGLYKLYIKNWKKLRFTDEFNKTVTNLQPLDMYDCESKRAWAQFLDTYGTHVVTGRHLGISTEVIKLIKFNDKNNVPSNLCVNLTEAFWTASQARILDERFDIVNLENWKYYSSDVTLNYLNSGMTFESMSNVVKKIDFGISYDVERVMREIWDGNLRDCV